VPTVAEVHPSVDGTGLEVSGWFATWAEDSDGEAFLPTAFDTAAPAALAVGLPVLYAHAKNEVPVGFVKSMEVRPAGLWGSIILPAPLAGTKAAEIYAAVKAKVLDKFSVGGFWIRQNIGGKVKMLCDRLVEVSLTATPTNLYARAAGVTAVRGVKAVGGVWVPAWRSTSDGFNESNSEMRSPERQSIDTSARFRAAIGPCPLIASTNLAASSSVSGSGLKVLPRLVLIVALPTIDLTRFVTKAGLDLADLACFSADRVKSPTRGISPSRRGARTAWPSVTELSQSAPSKARRLGNISDDENCT
jgi:HK97 family phage prohead protease